MHFISSWSLPCTVYERLKDLIMLTVMVQQLNLLISIFMIASCVGCSESCYLFGPRLFPFAARGIRSHHHHLAYLLCHLTSLLGGLWSLQLTTLTAVISFPSIVLVWVVEDIRRKLCVTLFGDYQPCNIIFIVLFVKWHLFMWFSKRLQRFLRITKIDYCCWVQIVSHQLLGKLELMLLVSWIIRREKLLLGLMGCWRRWLLIIN